MIKSAGDSEEMSGFKKPFSDDIQYSICDGCEQHCLQERNAVSAKKYQKKTTTTVAQSFIRI